MNQRGFVLPSFLLTPTGILAAIVVLLSVTNVIFFLLYNSKVEEHAEYVANIEAASAQAQAENARKERLAAQATIDVANQYADAMGTLARDYNSRLDRVRREHGACETVRRVSDSARVPDAAAADARSGAESFEAVAGRLEADCAATTATLLYLQDWVKRVKDASAQKD